MPRPLVCAVVVILLSSPRFALSGPPSLRVRLYQAVEGASCDDAPRIAAQYSKLLARGRVGFSGDDLGVLAEYLAACFCERPASGSGVQTAFLIGTTTEERRRHSKQTIRIVTEMLKAATHAGNPTDKLPVQARARYRVALQPLIRHLLDMAFSSAEKLEIRRLTGLDSKSLADDSNRGLLVEYRELLGGIWQ